MFLFFGINEDKADLGVDQQMRCPYCGRYGSLQVVMTYTVFTLFFLPLFKWNRKYYVRFDCCSAIYELNAEAGRYIEFYGADGVEIEDSDLTLLQEGTLEKADPFEVRHPEPEPEVPKPAIGPHAKRCNACGSECPEEFSYCPYCGNKL